jgi:hypothetical protein
VNTTKGEESPVAAGGGGSGSHEESYNSTKTSHMKRQPRARNTYKSFLRTQQHFNWYYGFLDSINYRVVAVAPLLKSQKP